MQIEFQNCSLEIGYIGTSDQIMIAMIRDACQVAADAINNFARWFVAVLAEAFERGAEMMRDWLAEDGGNIWPHAEPLDGEIICRDGERHRLKEVRRG